ncbi:hypothetical protein [uncultured Tenacibaculum sp.]|uniref:hypothetical protein n=1 Tax=uncultured Tenacibaculum sp. TaxID=174713 RepID=UPI00261FFDA1|nr:hypothetical protein [uncultured Tenacibaculum sp.]
MELTLLSFIVSYGAGIATDLNPTIYKILFKKDDVNNQIKGCFNTTLVKWCPNKDIREKEKQKLLKNIQINNKSKNIIDALNSNNELKRFYTIFEEELAKQKYQTAFNYLKSISDKVEFKDIKSQLSKVIGILEANQQIETGESNTILRESHKDIQEIKIQSDETKLAVLRIEQKLASLIEQTGFPNNTESIDQFVNEVFDDSRYSWVNSDKMKMLEKVLDDYNESISDMRQKFIFSQNITQSIFKISELQEITDAWSEDAWSPENLDHIRFIQGGIMAYDCLKRIPKAIINDFQLLNWNPIHGAYFVGHLGMFIREIKRKMKLSIDLVEEYRNDRYLFENLNRIFRSLKGYLEFDVNDLYIEKDKAIITKRLPNEFLVLVTDEELTIREVGNFDLVLAQLPLEKQFRTLRFEVVKIESGVLIIGCSSSKCFFWNPQEDITSKIFYKSESGERITNLVVETSSSGVIGCHVQVNERIIHFLDFQETQKSSLELPMELIKYKESFVGIKSNFGKRSGAILYKIDKDFNTQPLLTIEELGEIVKTEESVKRWLEENEQDDPFSNNGYDAILENITIQKIVHNEVDFLLIKGSIRRTSILILLSLNEISINYHAIVHLRESRTISIDYRSSGNDLELCAAYLDFGRIDAVCEYITLRNFSINTRSIIMKDRDGNDHLRDITHVSFGSSNSIYLTEDDIFNNTKILKYSISNQEFIEYELPNNQRFIDSSFVTVNGL